MVNLYFQPDAQLTVQDRMVLDILQKDYERFQGKPTAAAPEIADDKAHKQEIPERIDSASPEGTFFPFVYFTRLILSRSPGPRTTDD